MRKSIFQNSNENIVRILALEVFVASWGLPGFFLGLPVGFLIYNITYLLSPQETPKSFQEARRKLQEISGQKSLQNFCCFFVETMTPKRHFEIN